MIHSEAQEFGCELIKKKKKSEFAALNLPPGCEIAEIACLECEECQYVCFMPNFQFHVQTITHLYSPVLFDFTVSFRSVCTQSCIFLT